MPKHIRYGLIVGKGLPTDDDINNWKRQLFQVAQALEADQNYDRYMTGSQLNAEELDEHDAQLALYTTAIHALLHLARQELPPDFARQEAPANNPPPDDFLCPKCDRKPDLAWSDGGWFFWQCDQCGETYTEPDMTTDPQPPGGEQ